MALMVTNGAQCMCSFGMAPSALVVLPANKTISGTPSATIMDMIPMANIMPFGMCNSIANPTVAAATAASLGVLTPMPCIPVVTAPWAPGSPTVLIGSKPALTNTSKAICAYGGMIQIVAPTKMDTQVK